jgi:predicted glycosyltransferase
MRESTPPPLPTRATRPAGPTVPARPTLLFYCQHSLGLGHLARSLMLAEALEMSFDVVLLNGGRLPAGTRIPPGVQVVNLPSMGQDAAFEHLVSHDPTTSVAEAQARRKRLVIETFERTRPQVLLIELYPFGRKAFEFELLPLLEAVAAGGDARPKVLCSLRDILVNGRVNQARHDERASKRVNAFFDAVLVHSDPTFARLEESFRPETPLQVPVHYTGFVAPPARSLQTRRHRRLLVSSGGGIVGEPLVRAAVEVHAALHTATGLTTTVVAGPFLPEPVWAWLQAEAEGSPALTAIRQVPDLAHEIRCSALSLSQGGYNTTMDLLRAGTPAVVVPYSEGNENEQERRAGRLAELGVLRVVPPAELDAHRLLPELLDALAFRPQAAPLDLDGANTTARILGDLIGCPVRRSDTRPSPRTSGEVA